MKYVRATICLGCDGLSTDIQEGCRWNIFMGRVFLFANFRTGSQTLVTPVLVSALPDINWGRGREMKDSPDTAQCAETTCQAEKHTEPRGHPAGAVHSEFLS